MTPAPPLLPRTYTVHVFSELNKNLTPNYSPPPILLTTQPTVKTVRPCHDSGRWRYPVGGLQGCYGNFAGCGEDLPGWHNSGKGLTERAGVL